MKRNMRAMILERPGLPLRLAELPLPRPSRGKLLIEVEACGFEVIGGLLDAFVNAVQVKAKGGSVGKVRSRTLLGLLPSGGAGATSSYEQLLVVTDYVSGMTDSFAVELYQKIRGISLP